MGPTPSYDDFTLLASLSILSAGVAAAMSASTRALLSISQSRLTTLGTSEGAVGARFRPILESRGEIVARQSIAQSVSLVLSATTLSAALTTTHGWISSVALGISLSLGGFLAGGSVVGAVCVRRAERVAPLAVRLLSPLTWAVMPLSWVVEGIQRAVEARIEPVSGIDARTTETRVELAIAEGERAGTIGVESAEMIRNVLGVKDLQVREVMVARRQVIGIERETPIAGVLAIIAAHGHSRYPVFEGTIDNIVGILVVKELFAILRDAQIQTTTLSSLVRTPLMFVTEQQSAVTVLRDMRERRQHLAIVSDEFGGTSGIVTLEDIVEEIVGDIRDEFDNHEPVRISHDGRILADASVSLGYLSHALGTPFPHANEIDSLGGFMLKQLGHVPRIGDHLELAGVKYVVRDADPSRIIRVEIVMPVPRSLEVRLTPQPPRP